MKIKVDWKALKRIGFTKDCFRNGCCPEMAAVLHELIPNSIYVIGIWEENEEENEEENRWWLAHCVVQIGNETFDAEGNKAIERWDRDFGYPIEWQDITEDKDFDKAVVDYGGSICQKTIDKIKPYVKVVP